MDPVYTGGSRSVKGENRLKTVTGEKILRRFDGSTEKLFFGPGPPAHAKGLYILAYRYLSWRSGPVGVPPTPRSCVNVFDIELI
jgi:hypothetical protein